jgi:putative phosphoesterase
VKIGVLSDTHVPRHSKGLPRQIDRVFEGLDILLHLGDMTTLPVLDELQKRFTLTFAVAGERDRPEVCGYVEETRLLRFGQRQIAMIHGHQFQAQQIGWRFGLRRLLGRPPRSAALPGFLLRQFPDVDAILFGHTYEAYAKMHGSVLLFNPGAVAPRRGHRPSVGILEIKARTIAGKILYLDEMG